MSQRYTEIELDGKTRLLRYDFNAVADIEETLNMDMTTIMRAQRIGFGLTRALYWAGLKWKMKGLTLERTGQMLQKEVEENGQSFDTLIKPAIEALMKSGLLGKVSLDDEDETEDEEDPNESPA